MEQAKLQYAKFEAPEFLKPCGDELDGARRMIEIQMRFIHQRWEHPGVIAKWAHADSIRQVLKLIDASGMIAIGYYGAGKIDSNITMEDLITEVVEMREKKELYETSSDEKDEELQRLRGRVKILEEMLHLRGITT